jgi:hypothetical protein
MSYDSTEIFDENNDEWQKINRPISKTAKPDDIDCKIIEYDINNQDSFKTIPLTPPNNNLFTVSVAESITAGALSNTLCSEPGSSKFFLGGIIAYNMDTQEKILGVDAEYAEKNNFANPFTTYSMAKNVSDIFQSRIGISTTGFSLPTFRPADLGKGLCEINVTTPYAYICLYDSLKEIYKIYKITNGEYIANTNDRLQRAQMQVKVALACKKIFEDYCDVIPLDL